MVQTLTSPINWQSAQQKLSVVADGIPGPATFGALIATVGAKVPGVVRTLMTYWKPWGFTTAERLAEFLAQTSYESDGFRRWQENLIYSAERIAQVWPSRFPTVASALPYQNNPQGLANIVYGGRLGNINPGDGWTYRGRGAIQITGLDNYRKYGEILGLDLVGRPNLAAHPDIGTRIAGAFWLEHGINNDVDAGNFAHARVIVNGGTNGLTEIAQRRNMITAILA